MDETIDHKTTKEDRLLIEQLALLEQRKREVEALISQGLRVDEPLIDDLAGIVLVLRAALLRNRTSGFGREELEGYEREARDLFSTTIRHRY